MDINKLYKEDCLRTMIEIEANNEYNIPKEFFKDSCFDGVAWYIVKNEDGTESRKWSDEVIKRYLNWVKTKERVGINEKN